jgi:hypothetical protein
MSVKIFHKFRFYSIALIADSIDELRPDQITNLCGQDDYWLPVLQSAFLLNVSYNGFCNVRHEKDRGELGLCARLLFRFVKIVFLSVFMVICQCDCSNFSLYNWFLYMF